MLLTIFLGNLVGKRNNIKRYLNQLTEEMIFGKFGISKKKWLSLEF